jgi:hypothetical protein
MRPTSRNRAWQVHTALFVLGSILFIVLDLAQGKSVDSATLWGLEWAHILVLIWIPIVGTHTVLVWWDRHYEGLKDVVEVPFAPHRSKRQ